MSKGNPENNKKEMLRMDAEHAFRFNCYPGVPCFTQCCQDVTIVLTPYDVLRLKKGLEISSGEFLDRYTIIIPKEKRLIPLVMLKMNDDDKKCPFVSPDGCTIYEDRPGACHIYPLGRAALKVARERDTREKFFIVDEEHCLGFHEERKWSIEEWMANQGVDEYNAVNDQWLDIITSPKGLGPKKDIPRKVQTFYMASYNLDKFREFILKSRFFELFEVESSLKEKLAFDDVVLMKLAFDWLKFSLFGEKTIQIKRST